MIQTPEDRTEGGALVQRYALGATPPGPPPVHVFTVKREATAAVTYPQQSDWRKRDGQNWVTPAKNAGTCNSCVAFSAISVVESVLRIQKRDAKLETNLSEAHLFYCHNDALPCSNGWWPSFALDLLVQRGVATEAFYPYNPGNQTCAVGSGWEAAKVQIKGWKSLYDAANIKAWIHENGPVVACFEAFSDLYSYTTGVYKRGSAATTTGWHSVAIVGYNDKEKCWIAKNCWGTAWGDQGFFKIGYGECSIELYGMFGIEGITDSGWLRDKKVTALWANHQPNNAWALIESEGWKRIHASTSVTFAQLLIQLATAKNQGATVNIRYEGDEIKELYA